MSMKYHGVTVKIDVVVFDTETDEDLLSEDHDIFVQPPPHSYDRPQVLEVEAFAMAQVKFINDLYSRIESDGKLNELFAGKSWGVDAHLNSMVMKEL